MKTITQIYGDYKINKGLQEHMLRVTACAQIICEHSNQDLEKENIISACLLHDMGNLLKFDFETIKSPEMFEPEGVDFYKNLKEEWKDKYGTNVHEVTFKIAKEVGVSEKTLVYVDKIGLSQIPQTAKDGNLGNKINSYCDMRVQPFGIVSVKERLDDLFERYKQRHKAQDNEPEIRIILDEFEKEIFESCDIEPDYIDDNTAAPIIDKLKDYIPV